MSNYIFPYLSPIKDLWNYLTVDQNQQKLFEYRQHTGSLGTDWVSRYLYSEQDILNERYLYLHKQFNEEPELMNVLTDNIYRLSLFAGLERIITLRQAFICTRAQFQFAGNSFQSAAQVVLNGGIFTQGFYKGSFLNLLQFYLVPYQALIWSQKGGFLAQLAATSAFEALFYPLDTLKTAVYCDTVGKYDGWFSTLKDLMAKKGGLQGLFRGVEYKLGYNLIFLAHLRAVYDNSSLQWLSWPAWIASYGLLSMKSKLQIADSSVSLANLQESTRLRFCQTYAGVVPWAVFNYFFMYQFYGWYSDQAKNNKFEELVEEGNKRKSPFQQKVLVS
ncbi:hypothetical protein IMG5_110640 [Ichthyophthirius multifiliis]|uniref:Mitochondrial carrier protein n=1 Tax=Ichthyophthirius multifiliis TaxID=5932 RepID=G0QTQ6_ICHMU|nr:hypothetical protein IMG5_110640 [Ichthyophthirius multifiliis]EGR31405.1 hypothetical protein IMG5_110640 [Ichthyophthirius multifiliis]|eukprot:XP_004034891.1 hypothetical protein IMG5_110640 [Ichthyophthirius multifiliis]